MSTLNARANQAWRLKCEAEGWDPNPFYNQEDAFEEGWETGYKTAEAEAVERSRDFSGIAQSVGAAEAAEKIANMAEEYADDLEPPATIDWLELRDWFKNRLHEVAARAREIGGLAS